MKHFDYIFAGSGLSALMTAYRMLISGAFADKKVLIIDPDHKDEDDRTWCYWSKPGFEWDSLAATCWKSVAFKNDSQLRILEIEPYRYNMIRGIDFYQFVIPELRSSTIFSFASESVESIVEKIDAVWVVTSDSQYTCDRLMNSIYVPEEVKSQSHFPLIQQHFVGWKVRSDHAIFDPEVATFMDFSVAQKGNTRFMYVLPTSRNEALVEYTLFSADLLPENEYEREITSYLQNLGAGNVEITSKEKGAIPMTSFPFWKKNSKNIIYIGTAGGWTKASTGFTFMNASRNSGRLLEYLKNGLDFQDFHKRTRHDWYDSLLLDILSAKNSEGSKIFSSMFLNGDPQVVLKFLDAETSFGEDLEVIWRCPKRLFLNALWKRFANFRKS